MKYAPFAYIDTDTLIIWLKNFLAKMHNVF